jgi:hypothetical protein
MTEPLYLQNAGLVLTAPFLPRFFSMLDMTREQAWKDTASAMRAPHLLQWLVDERTSAPEPELVLNKVLCGLGLAAAIEASIEITEREKDAGTQLLKAMIANWTVISQTSVDGLRETFLQREGQLQAEADRWNLTVQRKALDVLVDRIPWSISVVRPVWMARPLFVTW